MSVGVATHQLTIQRLRRRCGLASTLTTRSGVQKLGLTVLAACSPVADSAVTRVADRQVSARAAILTR